MKDPYDVYIGRWNPKVQINSIWKNPFVTGKDGTREEVIQKFCDYLATRPDLLEQLSSLKGKVLGCWCGRDKDCHGDILAQLANAEQ